MKQSHVVKATKKSFLQMMYLTEIMPIIMGSTIISRLNTFINPLLLQKLIKSYLTVSTKDKNSIRY